MRKACDACAVRKVQCDGRQPCRRCVSSSFDCTFLKSRAKPGPKGPRKRTAEAIHTLQHAASASRWHGEKEGQEHRTEQSWPSPSERGDAFQMPCVSSDTGQIPRSRQPEWKHSLARPMSPNRAHEMVARIPTSAIARDLKSYESRAYSVWPVFDTQSIIDRLIANLEDWEAYGLATALCAASVSQFHTSCATSPVANDLPVPASAYEEESRRARTCYDYQERMSVWSLLTSFFLHVYAANIGKSTTSTLLLTESVAIAHILGLHRSSYYDGLNGDQQQFCLKVYWLLFITDRAHSFQQEIPTTLRRGSDLPHLNLRDDGSISANFMHLCALFRNLDEAINSSCNTNHFPTREAIARAQRYLNQRLPFMNSLEQDNEIQRADVFMTQQWMRVFLWQYSLSLTNLLSEDAAEEFSLSFPAQVAKTALGFVSNLSRESLEAHGPGMETKLFEITNALADVMICVPSLTLSTDNPNGGLSHHDVIHELCTLLASFRGGNPAVIAILREKLSTSDVQSLLMPSPDSGKFIDYRPLELADLGEVNENNAGDGEEQRVFEMADALGQGARAQEAIESGEVFDVF